MLAKSGEHPKVILITSAIPWEGKSNLCVNLAASFAQQGKNVLLVEADMRRPRLGQQFGLSSKEGLGTLLSSDSSAGLPATHATIPNLSVLLCGPIPPYPSELLASARMKELMREWRKQYDIVVLDGPPVLPVVDALILCEMADSTIQVARHNLTSRTSLKRAHGLLEAHTDRSIGVVLNAVSSRSNAYRGYYGYKQSEYYGSDTKP
jgi:capsular exopolysaccharide synthesis family protein